MHYGLQTEPSCDPFNLLDLELALSVNCGQSEQWLISFFFFFLRVFATHVMCDDDML